MSGDYDAIVIGSGMGGLATASLLAQLRGHRVLVLEQHFKVGGFTHTFSRHGYKFDVGVHYIGEMEPGSRTRQLFDLATASGVEWQKMPYVFEKFVYPDLTVSALADEEAYIQEICRHFPDESAAIKQYFKDITAVNVAVQMKSAAGMMPGLIAAGMNAFNTKYKSMALISTADYLNAHFHNPKLKAVLTSQWGDYGLPPSKSAFAIHALVATHYFKGGYYPIGSADSIAAAIVPIIKKAGGDVLVNHKVEEIIVRGGTARGVKVRTVQGELLEFRAKSIISDAGIYPTYTKLLPEGNRVKVLGFSEDLDASSISLYLGFKRSPEELGFKGENHWLHSGYDHDASYDSRKNLESQPGFAYLSFASLKDVKATAHTAQIISIASAGAFKRWENTSWKKRGSDYEQYKERATEGLLNLVEGHYPGFRDLVDYSELSTPLTVESFTGHPGGRIYGQPLTPEVMAQRPFKAETHVKNLYLSGSDMLAPGVIGAFMGGVFCAARVMGVSGLLEIMTESSRMPVKSDNARPAEAERELVKGGSSC